MKVKKIFNIIINVFTTFVIISAFFITIITIATNKDGVPSILGYSPFSIQSNSMYPTLKKGDLIIDKKVDIESLEVGDIISFFDTIDGINVIKTHRITDISTDMGVYLISTKGDNNDIPDNIIITDIDIVGKYNGIRIPYLGSITDFLKSKWGFLFCIIIPLTIMVIYYLIDFIKISIKYKMEEMD